MIYTAIIAPFEYITVYNFVRGYPTTQIFKICMN